jgi:hypothetical protein
MPQQQPLTPSEQETLRQLMQIQQAIKPARLQSPGTAERNPTLQEILFQQAQQQQQQQQQQKAKAQPQPQGQQSLLAAILARWAPVFNPPVK